MFHGAWNSESELVYAMDITHIMGVSRMATTVSAIYEDGVLRLLAPLPLPEHTPVEVTVTMPPDAVEGDPRQRVRAALLAAGLSRPAAQPWAGPPPLSTEERAALAQQVAAGTPLSAIIDEEREGR